MLAVDATASTEPKHKVRGVSVLAAALSPLAAGCCRKQTGVGGRWVLAVGKLAVARGKLAVARGGQRLAVAVGKLAGQQAFLIRVACKQTPKSLNWSR